MIGWGFMEHDGPVVAVQIRLAKGEITTAQYREIISRIMRNVSSFQQTSSIKVLQMRYAKSELTADQYHEQMANLMKKLYLHPWSPPLHILHTRYAEGEITTAQYEEMYANLTKEQFAYDQSTPLWIINNRYAQGDLSTEQYEEIVSLFTDYTVSLQREATNQSLGGGDLVQVPAAFSPQIPEPEKEKPAKTIDVVSDLKNEDIIKQPEKTEPSIPIIETSQQTGQKGETDSPGNNTENQKPPLDISSPALHTIRDLPELPPVAGRKTPTATQMSQSSPSIRSDHLAPPISPIAVPESVRSNFLYSGTGNMMGSDEDTGDVRVESELHINYSISPVSSPGGLKNTYETVTSHVKAAPTEVIPEPVQSVVSAVTPAQVVESEEKNGRDLNREVKLLIVKGKYEEAILLSTTMTEKNPGDYRALFLRGMSRYYLGLHDQALEDLNQAHTLCKNKKELKKIETIRSHILCKKNAGSDSEKCPEPELLTEELTSEHDEEQPAVSKPVEPGDDNVSAILDALGKKAQTLIDAREFKEAEQVLKEFIDHCIGLSKQRLQAESVDDIHAAMGYVMYQLKDYSQAKKHFQESLSINAQNDVANQFMKDILIRAAKQKK